MLLRFSVAIALFFPRFLTAAIPLPAPVDGAYPNCVQTDAAGNIYLAGSLNGDVFVAKISPDGSKIFYRTVFGGSKTDFANAIAVGSDGSVYLTGLTTSPDFPVTAGAMQTTPGYPQQAFATKLDATGKIQYATYIGGSTLSSGYGIAVDSSGNAYVSGSISGDSSGFPVTPGSIRGLASDSTLAHEFTGFLVKLDPQGTSALLSIVGFGGRLVALDRDGNIYLAGALSLDAPTTAGAFQPSVSNANCGTSGIIGPIPCAHQHVAKIDPTGTRLIFATYLSGNTGAAPAGLAIDADGNLVLAGITQSPDYPVTPGAYQPQYLFDPDYSFAPTANQIGPAPAGFVTKLNPNGTALVWSTFFSGSGRQASFNTWQDGDTINGMALDAAGNVVIYGTAKSADLPGLWRTPVAQRPTVIDQQASAGFVTRLTSNGVKLSTTELIPYAPSPAANALAVRGDGTAIVAPALSIVTLADPPRVASIADTDNTRLVRVAPGQLLTLWGTRLSPVNDAQPAGPFPSTFNGITVTFNGIAAPILFASGDQVNLQVPFEIAGQSEVTMQVSGQLGDPPFSEPFILGVVPRLPSVLISGTNFRGPLFGIAGCTAGVRCIQPLAYNADGSLNGPDHPAPAGSVVTLYVNGMGVTMPSQSTGAVAMSAELSPGLSLACCGAVESVLATETIPQSSTTLAQIRVRVGPVGPVAHIPLIIQDSAQNSAPSILRGTYALIWIQPASN
ncbi:MAG: SBBP repeat-containing protein [Acidobacteriia bacterium]|nr:SBBP repeat-containing protein [Terriglobia bacterium]